MERMDVRKREEISNNTP